ncbi:MAG: tetratricopeptide repeat protein, partial [Anaerolinea sp.]|nr:tetratricopeptide repeat protein [Anaerolinea sp.]
EAWLYACAELAVLEVRDDAWRFGHDKLREALLAGMTLDEQRMWSRAVASALETTYGRDPLHAGQIADLWFVVGEAARSLDYALIAVRHMIDISAQYDRAAELIMRALAAQPELALRAHLLGLLSETKEKRMQLDAAYVDSEVALTLAREANDPALIADTLIGLGNVFFAQSRYDDARGKYAEAETLIAQLNDERREANVVMRLGSVLRMQGQFADARAHFQRSLALYEAQGAEQWIGMIQNALGVCAMEQGNHDAALDHYERSQAISERIGDLRQRAATLNNITIVLINRGSFDSALDYSRRSLEIAQRIGYRNAILAVLNNLTSATYAQRNYELSAEYARETLALAREFGDRRVEAMALANLGSSLNAQRQFEAARDSMEAALTLFRDMNHRFGMSIMLSNLGEIYGNLGETARAVRCVRESLHLAVEVNSQTRKVAAIYAAARLLWSHFDQQTVAAWVWFGRRLPEIGQEMRDHYDELRAQIERERSDLVDEAEAASQQLDLAAVVEQIEAVLETYTREP